MNNSLPMSIMVDYFMNPTPARQSGNGEWFPDMEPAQRQAKSRPHSLVAWWRARQEKRALDAQLAKLWSNAPYLLEDIGMRMNETGAFKPIPEVDLVPGSVQKPLPQHEEMTRRAA